MNGWRLSWQTQSRRQVLTGELEIELGTERMPHIGMCLLENDERQEDVKDHDWSTDKHGRDADGRDSYCLAFEPGPSGARLMLRLIAEHDDSDQDPNDRYEAEIGLDFDSGGQATAHDLRRDALHRNHVPCGRRTTIDDGDVITLSENRKLREFRLRLKRLPVIFVISCVGLTSEADVLRKYLEVTQATSGSHFGCNLSAFRDAIERGGPGWPGACTLRFVGCDLLEESFHRALRTLANNLEGPVKLELVT